MAKELGLSPRSLLKNAASSQPWKARVKIWIRELYAKRQEKAAQKAQRTAAAEETNK